MNKEKICVKGKFTTNRESVSYNVVQEKMLNWFSKGR